jgi:Protein of unknown function (DUF3500)
MADDVGVPMTVRRLTRAVGDWLATLDADRRRRARFPFDDPDRFVWAFTPGDRQGLALRDMDPAQRDAALRIVEAAMSTRGAREVRDVIALESILGQIEREQGRSNWARRDPGLYWFAVFGEPDDAGRPWMWRIGGHHVAISRTVAAGEVVGSSPCFLGANPAVVPDGRPRAGERTLVGEEALARQLLDGLSPEARDLVIVDPVAPPEILTSNSARADPGAVPQGLRHADMDDIGRERLESLMQHYLERAPADIAAADWQRAVADGLSETTFAWAGSTDPGRGHYYAIRGPRFLVEYDNTQNGANHIHAVWRDLTNDWGDDLLAAHYRASHGGDG